MPDLLRQPREWFSVCDVDFGGELSEFEVIEGIGAALPVNRRKLTKTIRAQWHQWDPDGDGTVSMQEFIIQETGLRDWVLRNMQKLQTTDQEQGVTDMKRIPALDKQPMQWFDHWDRNRNGQLERDEIVRALIRPSAWTSRVNRAWIVPLT